MDPRRAWIHLSRDADGNHVFPPDRETGDGPEGYGTRYAGSDRQSNLNAVLNGDLRALGRDHRLVPGAMASRGEGHYCGYGRGENVPVNPYRLNGRYPASAPRAGLLPGQRAPAICHLRYRSVQPDRPDQGDREGAGELAGRARTRRSFSGMVTPYLGFTYGIDPTHAAYGSVTCIHQP